MTNEAALRDRIEDPLDFTVGSGDAIEKGALLGLVDPRVASGSYTASSPCAGIAAREKIAGDGRTQLAVFRRGVFDMVASGAIQVGDPVAMEVNNHVIAAVNTLSGAEIIGHALETGTAGERIQIYLNVGCGPVDAT